MPVTLLESRSDFQRAIAQSKLVVVDFYAVWCGPCKAVAPKIEEMSNTYRANVLFYKVNVDDLNVAQKQGISAMPTFHLYRSNKLLTKVVGANMKQLEEAIKEHMGSGSFETTGRVLGSGEIASTVNHHPTSAPSTSSSSPTSPSTSKPTFRASPPATTVAPASSNTLFWLAIGFIIVYYFVGMRNHSDDEPLD